MENKVEFTRIKNDVNGNPRYVCHFTDLLTEQDKENYPLNVSPTFKVCDNMDKRYAAALKNSRKLGGRKFHNKQYGGGIVFQSYNISELESEILNLKNQ